MEEIAEEAHVSKAGLYYYFKSKVHLFHYLLEKGVPKDDSTRSLPEECPSLTEGELLNLLKERLKKGSRLASVEKALERKRRDIDVEEEVSEIVEEMWELFDRNRLQIIILEKSAFEFPELATVYDEYARKQMLGQLERYLESRIRAGAIRPLASVATVSRALLEIIAWFGFKQWRGETSPLRYPKSEALPELISVFAKGLKN